MNHHLQVPSLDGLGSSQLYLVSSNQIELDLNKKCPEKSLWPVELNCPCRSGCELGLFS
ncbi:hypothetical protein IHE45_15G100700 [Dioscorea alata]|uniref:Uncharacterized protein n=1 Tax=Dioscorea alata TaxID=55571 RepID=A0ACB7UN93_DIOAL|nr:hypothetical protein IHE45_15G100700 [Dioscorea alata]